MPMPTLGPGQDFEDEEIDQSQINVLHGDDEFGYGQFLDNEDLYIMWITDEDGTHYLVVDEGNDVLFGKYDQLTGERREDESFMQFLIERTVKQNQLSEIEREIEGKEKLRDGLFFTGYVVLFGGLAICIFASAGACSIATPIVGTGGIGLAGTAVTEAVGVDNAMDRYNDKLKEIRYRNVQNDKRAKTEILNIVTKIHIFYRVTLCMVWHFLGFIRRHNQRLGLGDT